jgi:hypothetical protein
VNNNRICPTGAMTLVRGLQNNESITSFHIKGNPIGEDGFTAIVSAIIYNTRNVIEHLEYPKLDFPSKETVEIMQELSQMKKSSQSDHNFQFCC